MSTHYEIAQYLWRSFCDEYSRQHRGWRVKVDTYDPAVTKFSGEIWSRPKPLVANLMFQGIIFEDSRTQAELSITVGGEGELITHRLKQPAHIIVLKTDAGLHEGLLIHDQKGGLIQVRFREPANPELMDGWMGMEKRRNRLAWFPEGAL